MLVPSSYLSTVLKNQFDHTAEAVLPTLINLITNSAKVRKLFFSQKIHLTPLVPQGI